MTPFEFLVPLIALGVGLGLALYVHLAARRMDARAKDHPPVE